MKWAALVRNEIQTERNQAFSDYLNQKGYKNTLMIEKIERENFNAQIHSLLKKNQLIRVSNHYGEILPRLFDSQTPQVMSLGAADTVVKQGVLTILRSAQYSCCLDIFKRQNYEVNTKKSGLVIGLGALARYAVASLIQIGVKKISVISPHKEKAQSFIASILKFSFDIEIVFLSEEDILKASNEFSVVINTIEESEESKDLFDELQFFNFVSDHPVVWDLVLSNNQSRLLKEAMNLQFRIIDGIQFSSETDLIWSSWLIDHKLDWKDYEQTLRQKMSPPENN